jgi:toxin YoeB
MSKIRLLTFDENGWEDYTYWLNEDRKFLTKINKLITEILRTPFTGSGKPEGLKGDFSGLWSRRIDQTHRIVYSVRDDQVIIIQCRYHY